MQTCLRPDGIRSDRGLTLFEVTLVLTVSISLLAALAPTIAATLRDARTTRAISDMEAIRDAILNFLADGFPRFTNNGSGGVPFRIQFLYSDGDIPAAGSTSVWQNTTADNVNDFLEEHLVLNSFNGGNSYPTSGGPPDWRGAYIEAPVDPDPWGNRYAVNVQWLGGGPGGSNDVVVHSAGPDETESTAEPANPVAAGGDDIIVLVES